MSFKQIFIGDLVRTYADLMPEDDAARNCVRKLLQLEMLTRPVPPILPPNPPANPPVTDFRKDVDEQQDTKSDVDGDQSLSVSSSLQSLSSSVDEAYDWVNVPPLQEYAERASVLRPAPEPLFAPRHRSAIVSTAMSSRVPEGQIDLERIVGALSECRLVMRIPCLLISTLRRGAHILVDVGEGMFPYMEDQAQLLASIRHVVGQAKAEVKEFVGTPRRGVGTGLRSAWKPWRIPARDVPIVLLSDLGIGGSPLSEDRAFQDEWLKFCRQARQAACPVIAFVPYSRRRCPPLLAREMMIVEWDRKTTLLSIINSLRRQWR